MDTQKKKFPKVQKKIGSFLTPESRQRMKKITANTLLTGMALIHAAPHTYANVTHANYTTSVCGVGQYDFNITYDPGASQCTVAHSSGLINGHYSGTADYDLNADLGGVSHVSGHSWAIPCCDCDSCSCDWF